MHEEDIGPSKGAKKMGKSTPKNRFSLRWVSPHQEFLKRASSNGPAQVRKPLRSMIYLSINEDQLNLKVNIFLRYISVGV